MRFYCLPALAVCLLFGFRPGYADSNFADNRFIINLELGNYFPHERFELATPSSIRLGGEYRFMPYLAGTAMFGFGHWSVGVSGEATELEFKTTTGRPVYMFVSGVLVLERQAGLSFYGSEFLSLGPAYEWAISGGAGNYEWHQTLLDFTPVWGGWVSVHIWHNASRRVQLGIGATINFWVTGDTTADRYPSGILKSAGANASHTTINLSMRYGF